MLVGEAVVFVVMAVGAVSAVVVLGLCERLLSSVSVSVVSTWAGVNSLCLLQCSSCRCASYVGVSVRTF